jgi:hypothetical protein
VKFKSMIGRNVGKPVSIAEALTGRTTKWIASKFGVSESTARRWRSGKPSHAGGPPSRPKDADKAAAVMDSAKGDQRRKIAANAMRAATAINVGAVDVESDTGNEKGKRRVGTIVLGAEGRSLLQQAGDALEAGNWDLAERLHDQAILHADGRDYGPLHVTGYGSGFNYI